MSFPVTRWTLIIAASLDGNPDANTALSELCRSYWYPVYAFIRRSGNSPADSEDLTQEFFVRFLEKRDFTHADRAKGRFRSFLLTGVKHFLSDEWDRATALKRGGQRDAVPLDAQNAERWYPRELSDRDTPERLFEREWAMTLMLRVNEDLRMAFVREGRADYFDRLRVFLPGSEAQASYAEIAVQMGSSEGAVRVAVHRIRGRYREVFRAQIAMLVADPDMIEGEVQYVLDILRG